MTPELPGQSIKRPGARLGPWVLERRLAVGGMGEVWLAQDAAGAVVVLKTLLPHLKDDDEFLNMFLDEARLASALQHPAIARLHGLGQDRGEYFLVMEYVAGPSLREVMAALSAGPLTMPLALKCRVIAEAAHALHHAHRATTPDGAPLGLIHRDVSPPNILLGADGAVKLIDFGVAKAASKLVRTATGVIRGKHAYMSPEQAWGQALDARSDVFSLGVVAWELLTGQRLFRRESDVETLRAVVGAKVKPPSEVERSVPRDLDAVVKRALDRTLQRRTTSAAQLAHEVEAFLARQRLSAGPAALAAWLSGAFPPGREATSGEPTETASLALPDEDHG